MVNDERALHPDRTSRSRDVCSIQSGIDYDSEAVSIHKRRDNPMIPKEQSPKFINIAMAYDKISGEIVVAAIDEIGNVWWYRNGWTLFNMTRNHK